MIFCKIFSLDVRTVAINKILLLTGTLTNSSEILSTFAKITVVFNKLHGKHVLCAVITVVNVHLGIILNRKFRSSKMDGSFRATNKISDQHTVSY